MSEELQLCLTVSVKLPEQVTISNSDVTYNQNEYRNRIEEYWAMQAFCSSSHLVHDWQSLQHEIFYSDFYKDHNDGPY